MKYFSSFRTTVKISRYLFRTLALLLWSLGALLSAFYIISLLHQREAELRQEFYTSIGQAQSYISRTASIAREIKYVAENRLSSSLTGLDMLNGVFAGKVSRPQYIPLYPTSRCPHSDGENQSAIESLSYFLSYWKDSFSDAYDLNRVFYINGESLCMAEFNFRSTSLPAASLPKNLQQQVIKYRNARQNERTDNLYWVEPGNRAGSGYLYVLTPIYVANKLEALLGIELSIRLEDFSTTSNLPIGITLLDQNNNQIMSLTDGERKASALDAYPMQASFFGYTDGYKNLVMKKNLPPSTLSIVYSLSLKMVIENFKSTIINALLLNLLSAILIAMLSWLFERKIIAPAEKNALQLEENEQFNRKIVASAPVGICILRISDGANLISNELAHNYLSLLTVEDRQRIIHIICGQQVNVVDVITSNNNNLQISFVHSRYLNENVAICVLVDISARVRLEESLQEMAAAAEQTSQAKSMFLATVSHELRTPLYGIIGNLDLIKTKALPEGVDRLVMAMDNSSALLLNIISDILDFSKIESEQLKIEPKCFSPREVVSHIAGNFLSLVVKKRLGLFCFIDPDVPLTLLGDPVRLQQVLSNLLNNAIKFTHSGCILIRVYCQDDYLHFCIRDTGVGIGQRELLRLFDPFVQLGSSGQQQFQGTGLGLAICEKLVNLMDGDITVESESDLGSMFIIRLPLYQASYAPSVVNNELRGRVCWLSVRNVALETYLTLLLTRHGLTVKRHTWQEIDADAVFISDNDRTPPTRPSVWIRFMITHIGPALEISEGEWWLSPAFADALSPLLLKIYRVDHLLSPALVAVCEPPVDDENQDIRILVVDDHPINRRLLSDQLESIGYQVISANDGIDAMNLLQKQSVDIILTDVNMPNMDGYQLTRRLRSEGVTLPVIGVTANALAEEKQRCLDAGMDGCLSKPVTLSVLQPALAQYGQQIRDHRHHPTNGEGH
ncbi:two-component system sensor histidine kinase RcsC [Acerihabitans sp. TG2]|uniref:two-component system sensor histidine kinase RcsC n=1 Tax=Acerihabitans sp. TG2 TaxID=3096008 RepID=UPI002B226659|nr:two-component system sensor histidine kinase RcsC [Acerihabitans sp. TG2]MEA9389182.1 two-component system sensor histidine kinase RcsC [Acerihabitans sp. TG2]